MALAEVTAIAEEATRQGRIMGLRLPVDDDEEEEPWAAAPSRRKPQPPIVGRLPEGIEAVMADQIYISCEELPAGLVNRLVQLAAFQNPAFYSAQAMCRKPRFRHRTAPLDLRNTTRRRLRRIALPSHRLAASAGKPWRACWRT
jgi:hypothetical protein